MIILTTTDPGNVSNTNVTFYISSGTPTQPSQRVTVPQYAVGNAGFTRAVQLSSEYVFIKRGTSSVAIPIADLANIAVGQDANLSYSPLITVQPLATSANSAANAPDNTASFNVSANSESTLNYAWMQNAAGSWSELSNGSTNNSTILVESNVLNIATTTNEQNGFGYLCIVQNSTGNTNTNEVTLTVT